MSSFSNTPDDDLGSRLSVARQRRGWSMRELARQAELDASVISNIEAGKTPSPQIGTLRKLADALGIPTEALTAGAPPVPRSDTFGGITRVPVVRYAGRDGEQTRWTDDGTTDLLPSELARGRRLLATRVVGPCMEPEIIPGDLVIFDRARREPRNGELVVVTDPHRGLLVKYLVQQPSGPQLYSRQIGLEPLQAGAQVEGIVVRLARTPTLLSLPTVQ